MKNIRYDMLKLLFKRSKVRLDKINKEVDYSYSYINDQIRELLQDGYIEKSKYGVYEITVNGRKAFIEEKK